MKNVLHRINYIWQNFIEDMFGMGNFSKNKIKTKK